MRFLSRLSIWSVLTGALLALLLGSALSGGGHGQVPDAAGESPREVTAAQAEPVASTLSGRVPASAAGLAALLELEVGASGSFESKGGSYGGGGSGSSRGGYSSSSQSRRGSRGYGSSSRYDDDDGYRSGYGRGGGCVGCFGFGGFFGTIVMIGIIVVIASFASRMFR